MLIDTHAHLYWEDFQHDFDEVIQRALMAGVQAAINIGVDPETSQKALRQAQGKLNKIPKNFTIYSSIGIHPHEALRYTQGKLDFNVSIQKDITALEEISQEKPAKVVMVGECGLDFLFNPEFLPTQSSIKELKQAQVALFQAQIDLAKKLNLPLSVHCRDDRSQKPDNTEAWDEVLKIVGDHPAVLHCYSGLLPTTNYILQTTNLLVSFAATLTYPKNDYLIEAVKILPLDRIMVETDCPFLPPQGRRGSRNEPANILSVINEIAKIKGVSLAEVKQQTTQNTLKLLSLNI